METKRIAAGLLAVGLLGGTLTGCGGGGTEETASPTPTETTSETAPAASETTPTADVSATPSSTETAKPANEITVGIAQDLDDSLDPHKMVAAGTKEVLFNVFEGLMKPTSNGDLVPAIAEKYTLSEDKRTYTFSLREGVQFHNGEAVTADDVVWSLARCADTSESETPLVPAFSVVENIEKIDEQTVAVTIDEPSNEFISYMTAAIIPEQYEEQDTQPIGTGPFQFISRSAQDNLILEKFDDYWGTPAYLDKVTYKIMENADSLVMSLQSGAIDVCAHLTSTQTAQLGDDFNIEEGTMNLVQALYLNHAEKPFDNVKVRQALCYALDRQTILDVAFDGYGSPIGSSMYPAFGKYFMPELTDYYSYDPEKAKSLLTEAGYPDGFDMTITVPSNYQPHVDTAQVVVEQLKAVGVNAKINLVEWGTWVSEAYQGRQFQSTLVGVDASNMTARALLERYTSDNKKNFINYNNADYDSLFEQALSTYDDAQQTEIYKQMEKNLTENAANVYIQDLADLVAIRKGLTGLQFYPIYVLDVSTLRWES